MTIFRRCETFLLMLASVVALAAGPPDYKTPGKDWAKGPVKSKGRYGSATVRGTVWTMKDTCSTTTTFRSGTLVVVTEGVVAVADFAKHKTVLVKAGKRYFAAAIHTHRY